MQGPWLLALVVGGLVWLYSRRNIATLPARGSPASARIGPSGSLISIPGVGGFATGPGGTSLVLDPRLFGGLLSPSTGTGSFNPGSGITSPLLPGVGGGAAAGAPFTAVGGPGVDPATQADGTVIGLPSPMIPPETPTQVPVDPLPIDPTLIDPSALVPQIIPDPSLLDPGMTPQFFDAAATMIF